MNLNIDFDFDDLTLDNIGSWPLIVRVGVIIAACLIIFIFAFWIDTRNQLKRIESNRLQIQHLKEKFSQKYHLARNLNNYQQQLKEMQLKFAQMLRELPSRTEAPGLLEDVSKVGIKNGLEFLLFAPQQEIKHGFYAESPIQISVIGNYHELANFVSDVAALDRIVTFHDFKIKSIEEFLSDNPQMATEKAKKYNADDLIMEAVAETYRYLEQEHEKAE